MRISRRIKKRRAALASVVVAAGFEDPEALSFTIESRRDLSLDSLGGHFVVWQTGAQRGRSLRIASLHRIDARRIRLDLERPAFETERVRAPAIGDRAVIV